jgi:hypothetical protein
VETGYRFSKTGIIGYVIILKMTETDEHRPDA